MPQTLSILPIVGHINWIIDVHVRAETSSDATTLSDRNVITDVMFVIPPKQI